MPRVAIKRFQPLDSLAKRSRLQLMLHLADTSLIPVIARELASAKGGNGLVHATVPVSEGREASLLLGRDFNLDADLAARLSARITRAPSAAIMLADG